MSSIWLCIASCLFIKDLGAGWRNFIGPPAFEAFACICKRAVPAPKSKGGGTQVAACRIFSMPLNDPAISHTLIDTMVTGLFNVFLLWVYGACVTRRGWGESPRLISGSIGLNPETPLLGVLFL